MHKKAFTLIELLVVIVIIGLLASIITINYSNYRSKARDVRRKEDFRILKDSFNLYYAFHNQYLATASFSYDTSIGCISGSCTPEISFPNYGNWVPTSDVKRTLLESGILNNLPIDPINKRNNFYYIQTLSQDVNNFWLYVVYEQKDDEGDNVEEGFHFINE